AAEAGAGYSDLEISLASGKRGSRYAHISELLSQVTGADAAIVVNNNAAAVMLVLTALGAGKEVVVSRGEAVEIGGGFRIPDVLRQSGATLVEVGTTNRTYARDFEAAAGKNTAAFLKVHASNFKVTGFTAESTLAQMVEVGERHGIPVLHDLGSGALLDTAAYGMATEPMVQQSVSDGAGLAMFSGDKLLGGPQAGIIVGKAELVKLVERHPMARALRVEKITLAALSATLIPYLKGTAPEEIPVWQMISASAESIAERAKNLLDSVDGLTEIAELRDSRSAVGGGSLPGETLPSTVVAVTPPADAESLLAALRSHSPPIIARIEKDDILLDPRTMLPGEDAPVAEALAAAIRA
ncbi:MAG: L-seryl-tRNA(Sec) selenium transferase, partial [Chloroflexi bacterium]|nr:L-seryl-tRNA(Sec) selenium transferase [Chloroflexota bacterium]